MFLSSGPLIADLCKDNSAEFYFLDGAFSQPAGEGIAGLYDGPYYGYFRCDCLQAAHDQESLTMALGSSAFRESVNEAYDLISEVIDHEGPFDGVIGFSHGGTLAFQFLLHHAETNPLDPAFALFKCAVFIAAPAPFRENGLRLKADSEPCPMLKLPTVHIVGKNDALYTEALNLYKLCDDEMATLVVHEKGHLVPRDHQTTSSMARAVRSLRSKTIVI